MKFLMLLVFLMLGACATKPLGYQSHMVRTQAELNRDFEYCKLYGASLKSFAAEVSCMNRRNYDLVEVE